MAPDLRGHGQAKFPQPFRLEDCADDVAALAEILGIESLIGVGYSMGGLVAQLLWRRHRRLVEGLVLCSTTHRFCRSPLERLGLLTTPALVALARSTPAVFPFGLDPLSNFLLGPIHSPALRRWLRSEVRRVNLASLASAASSVGSFASEGWLGDVDVPTAVIVTEQDQLVTAARQVELAEAIPGATVHHIEAGHGACIGEPHRFVPVLLEACRAVQATATGARRAA